MRSGFWKNRPSGLFTCLLLLSAAAFVTGCSSSGSGTSGGGGQPVSHLDVSGNPVSTGWVVTPGGGQHAITATNDYISGHSPISCAGCHGVDLTGGVSGVSCFGNPTGCHHGGISKWVATPPAPQPHGDSAKKAPGESSFFSCQICHGSDFSGGGAKVLCFPCHGANAPHAPKPWRTSAGSVYAHGDTNTANAPACYQCHAYSVPQNPNNPHQPPVPAPTGVSPGCFNGTMCHNEAGHPAGWVTMFPAAQPHGDTAKKDGTVHGQGFPSCQECHGADFAGGSVNVSCFICHTDSAPHAPKPWRGTPYTHTNTVETGNAPVCYTCHSYTGTPNPRNPHIPPSPALPGTAPGCFNGTMCHNAAGHPPGWVTIPPAAQPHGDTAKKDGTAHGQGLTSCQPCHGADFAGGSVNVSCFICHTDSAPHAPKPWRGTPYTHTTTVEAGNAPVCYQCHAFSVPQNPRNPHQPPVPAPAGTSPGCFNGTMCHNAAGHAVPFNSAVHYSVTSGTFTANCGGCHDVTGTSPVSGAPLCTTCHIAGSPLTALNCTSCHADPPTGGTSAYPNAAGAHAAHIALNDTGTPISCNTCHNGLGTNTLNHYNRANARPGKNALRVPPGDIAFLATYNAKTGASSFDNSAALTCSNVSCHGGQTTPNWRTGTLNVNTQCTNCHTRGTSQYNSNNSGEHGLDEHRNRACTVCHNTTTLAVNHFTKLSTPAMEGPASATIGGSGTSIRSWNPTTKSCTPTCHDSESWSGGN